MKSRHLSAFVLSLFLFQEVHGTVDLRARFGPVLDKGNVGWCYAYVAADLLGHWLNSRYPQLMNGQLVSATGIVLAEQQSRRSESVSELRGMHQERAIYQERVRQAELHVQHIESEIAAGRSSQTELDQARLAVAEAQRKAQRSSAENLNVTEREDLDGGKASQAIIRALQQPGLCYASSLVSEPLQVPEAATDLQTLGMNEYSVAQLNRVMRRFLAGISDYEPYQNLLERVFTRFDFSERPLAELVQNSNDPVGELFNTQCRDVDLNLIEDPVFTERLTSQYSAAEIFQFAVETLDLSRPVELVFNSSILGHPGAHAATLVGYRRTVSGEVEFLLRNMWGRESCALDRARMEAAGESVGFTCEPDGHYWIPQATIEPVLGSVVRIENY